MRGFPEVAVVPIALLAACSGPDPDIRQAPRFANTPVDPPVHSPPSETGTSTDPTGTETTPTVHTSPDGDPWTAVPVPPELPAGTLTDIEQAIDAVVESTVASTGVYVLDAENGQAVYGWDENDPKTPASNTKLFTTGLAFDQLGEDHRMMVTAYADQVPDPSGAVGDLTIVSEHDFSWTTWFYESDTFAADRLVDRLYDAGLRSVDGTLVVAGEYLIDGYQFGYFDAAFHRALASDVLLEAFGSRGIDVGAIETSSSFTPPAGAVVLASRGSVPLSVGAHPLNVYSHNEFADILSHHDGYELGGASTYAAGTAAVVDWLAGVGIDTTGLDLNDGSGLSHDNFVTPRQVCEMLEYLLGRPAGIHWQRTFSTAGVLGTLGGRMLGAETSGRFFGKTGSLTGVIATSGVLYHTHDGHRYFVSVLMNDVADDSYARSLQDDVVEVVARDWRGLGNRPADPVLRSVLAPGDGTVVADWDDVSAADGYIVWLSRDGYLFDRADARYVTGTSRFVIGAIEPDTTYYVRITATNGAGWSDPSDVLGGRSAFVAPSVLIVDGNDRWDLQWENAAGTGHDFVVAHGEALGARTFESVANEAVIDGTVDLLDYDAVLWMSGEESTEDSAFDGAEQGLVADAVAGGTALLVSGSEVGWDLSALGEPADQAFFSGVLHAGYDTDDAGTFSAEPIAGGLFDGVGELGFYTPGTEEAAYPDVLVPGPGGVAALGYVGGTGGTAAVAYDDGIERVVLLGFPFETIDDAPTRALVMERVLAWFGI